MSEPRNISNAPAGRAFVNEPEGRDVNSLHSPVMRELSEPRDGYEPVPMWLMFVFFAFIGWGGWYVGNYSGNWSGSQFNESPTARAGGPAEAPKPMDAMTLGKRTFNNCIACHQADAKGLAGQYPPLAESEYVNGDPKTLARILLHGLHGPLTVEGKTFNNEMPAWGGTLSDQQIADVLTYVRASFGNNSGPVEADLVKEVREATKGKTGPWTIEELKALEK